MPEITHQWLGVRRPAAAVLAALLAGCLSHPEPIIDAQGVNMAQLEQDLRRVTSCLAHRLDVAAALDRNPVSVAHEAPNASPMRAKTSSTLPTPSTSTSRFRWR